MYTQYQMQAYGGQQIIRVNGENGARTYTMPPNSSTLLLDENAPIVWLAQTDGAGYKTVTPYKIEPYQPEPKPDLNALADRISKLEEMIHDKSNLTNDQTAQQNGQYKRDGKR